MNDIFQELKDDHEKQRTLVDLVAKTHGNSSGRRELFTRLVVELRAHANAEERTLYAEMLGNEDAQPKASHSVHEHEEMDDLMEELENTDLSSSGWIATFEKLAEKVHHHLDEEEEETFRAGRRHIDGAKAAELGRRFREEKSKELGKKEHEPEFAAS